MIEPYTKTYNMIKILTSASPWIKVAFVTLAWCAVWGTLILAAYFLRGPSAAWAKYGEFVFVAVVAAFVIPAIAVAQRAEPRLKKRFPVGAPFIAITFALVLSVALGLWAAIVVTREFL